MTLSYLKNDPSMRKICKSVMVSLIAHVPLPAHYINLSLGLNIAVYLLAPALCYYLFIVYTLIHVSKEINMNT